MGTCKWNLSSDNNSSHFDLSSIEFGGTQGIEGLQLPFYPSKIDRRTFLGSMVESGIQHVAIPAIALAALTGSAKAAQSTNPIQSEFQLVTRFAKRVTAALTTSVLSPQTKNGTLKIYAPVPPNTPLQKVLKCSIDCLSYPQLPVARSRDLKNPCQEYLTVEIPVNDQTLQQKCTVKMTYIVDLYEARLMRGRPLNGVRNDFGDSNLLNFTKESTHADFNHPAFQSWLKRNDLVKRSDETNLAFGYRAFQFLCQFAKPGTWKPADRAKASILCQEPNGDCGAMTILFVSVMRANSIPTVACPGRWALDETKDYGQFHANCALFDPAVGWVPTDLAFGVNAVRDRKNPNEWYGKGEGQLITFGSSIDFVPEERVEVLLNQFMIFTYKGSSPYVPTYEDHWNVQQLR